MVVVVLIRARIRGTTSPRGVCLDPLLYSDYWAVDSQADVSNFKVGNILHLHHSWKKTDDSISALSKGSSLVLLLYTAIAIAIALVLCACSDILKYTRIVVLKIAGSVFPDYRHSREKGYITSKAEITVYSVSSNPGLNMNSKALAQQISSWYTSHVDSYATHGSNMNRYLRGPVIALTVRIIGSTESGLESEQAHQPHFNFDYVRSYICIADREWTKDEQRIYDSLNRQTRARMKGFLEGCALAVPNEIYEIPGEKQNYNTLSSTKNSKHRARDASNEAGFSGFKDTTNGSPMLASIPVPQALRLITSNSSSANKIRYPQFRQCELTLRLELYIRSLNHVRSLDKQVVIELESFRSIKARAITIVRSFVATVGCVRGMRPCLTLLIQNLTQEVLAVDCICNEISKVIRRLVSEYEHQTSFASLAFLSSPENSAEKRLTPLLISYLQYLQTHWEMLVEGCELESMLGAVLPSEMRHLFKTIEFRSIGHLVEVCQGFQKELESIELPPSMGGMTSGDLDSTCSNPKAIKQAIRDLQREVITVNGHALPPVSSRKELLELLSQMLNSRSISLPTRKSKRNGLSHNRQSTIPPCHIPILTNQGYEIDSEGFISSGNEGDTDDGNIVRRLSSEEVTRKGRGRRFHVSTISLMTRRLLLASSRTGMGGDAYFIVRDLFGGDDVEVVPSRSQTARGKTHTGTIEIVVRLASVTIKCHASFDIYPKSGVGDFEPLIQLHTTTTETISLRESRSRDRDSEDDSEVDRFCSNLDENEGSKMVLEEKKSDRTGWRTLTIGPALYEAVEKWTTPS